MAISLNTNVAAYGIQGQLKKTQSSLETSMQRLSSGLRVNSARDDAAGLAIGSRMEAQIRGMSAASRNTNDAISLVQIADSSLSNIGDMFQKMRELAVTAGNGTHSTKELELIDTEYQQLALEVTRVANTTKFNGIDMISTKAGTFNFQVGANSTDTLSVTTVDAKTYLAAAGDLKSAANATTAIGALDTALDSVNSSRATYGAAMNRLDYTSINLEKNIENQSSARGRIMDADFAMETANLAKQQILQQAGAAMLAQANQFPSLVLSLLRG